MADLRPLNIDDNVAKSTYRTRKVAIMPGYTHGEEGRGFVRLNAGCPRSKLEKVWLDYSTPSAPAQANSNCAT